MLGDKVSAYLFECYFHRFLFEKLHLYTHKDHIDGHIDLFLWSKFRRGLVTEYRKYKPYQVLNFNQSGGIIEKALHSNISVISCR